MRPLSLYVAALVTTSSVALATDPMPAAFHVFGRASAVDGDSLRVQEHRIRLLGIDAPELHQNYQREGEQWPCGLEVRSTLSSLTQTPVDCVVEERDRYGRYIAVCYASG